ncbi:microtubule-associated proteins 1A/1B light chain 3C-like [Callorhinchus milii]|uniref:microtubule-associated proteins 1A/1B light chain 3C-like n=1 Tax=Callorhinchus milii TaxID=7868 RepID=UPI001C3FDE75|nr:microtubule-associated proteins 1A/1B light chain 3C-like [Callorhinchus milii]
MSAVVSLRRLSRSDPESTADPHALDADSRGQHKSGGAAAPGKTWSSADMYRSHRAQRFKHAKSAASRKAEAAFIRDKYPQKIPVIVERYPGELYLPFLDKAKFLVPQEMTMCQFVTIIRDRLALSSSQTFYLLVKNRSLVNMCATMCELDQDYKDSDGFLYMTYASQEMFGSYWSRFVSVPGKTRRWEPCGVATQFPGTIADLV